MACLSSVPAYLTPAAYRIPKYALASKCPHCGHPVIFVWVMDAKGRWHARPIAVRSWSGETVYVPSKHIYHGIKCLYALRHAKTIQNPLP